MRGNLSKLGRITLGALITIDVHARDVTAALVAENVNTVGDFEWISQVQDSLLDLACVSLDH